MHVKYICVLAVFPEVTQGGAGGGGWGIILQSVMLSLITSLRHCWVIRGSSVLIPVMYLIIAFAMTHALKTARVHKVRHPCDLALAVDPNPCALYHPVSCLDPYLRLYPSGSIPGTPVANPMSRSCAGSSSSLILSDRFFLLFVMTMVYRADPAFLKVTDSRRYRREHADLQATSSEYLSCF